LRRGRTGNRPGRDRGQRGLSKRKSATRTIGRPRAVRLPKGTLAASRPKPRLGLRLVPGENRFAAESLPLRNGSCPPWFVSFLAPPSGRWPVSTFADPPDSRPSPTAPNATTTRGHPMRSEGCVNEVRSLPYRFEKIFSRSIHVAPKTKPLRVLRVMRTRQGAPTGEELTPQNRRNLTRQSVKMSSSIGSGTTAGPSRVCPNHRAVRRGKGPGGDGVVSMANSHAARWAGRGEPSNNCLPRDAVRRAKGPALCRAQPNRLGRASRVTNARTERWSSEGLWPFGGRRGARLAVGDFWFARTQPVPSPLGWAGLGKWPGLWPSGGRRGARLVLFTVCVR
jgi:hypothetical protein